MAKINLSKIKEKLSPTRNNESFKLENGVLMDNEYSRAYRLGVGDIFTVILNGVWTLFLCDDIKDKKTFLWEVEEIESEEEYIIISGTGDKLCGYRKIKEWTTEELNSKFKKENKRED